MRIEIFLIVLIVVLCYASDSNKKQLKSSHHKHKKNFQQRVAIGHKQYVVKNNSSKSRNSRVINIQNHWEKIPYIFQTYKFEKFICYSYSSRHNIRTELLH